MIKLRRFSRSWLSIEVALACCSLCLMDPLEAAQEEYQTNILTTGELANKTLATTKDPILDLLEQIYLVKRNLLDSAAKAKTDDCFDKPTESSQRSYEPNQDDNCDKPIRVATFHQIPFIWCAEQSREGTGTTDRTALSKQADDAESKRTERLFFLLTKGRHSW